MLLDHRLGALTVEAVKVVSPGVSGVTLWLAYPTTLRPATPNKPARECAPDAARLRLAGASCPRRRMADGGSRMGDAAAAAGLRQRQAFCWLARHRAGRRTCLLGPRFSA